MALSTDGIRSPQKNTNFDNTTFHESSVGLVITVFLLEIQPLLFIALQFIAMGDFQLSASLAGHDDDVSPSRRCIPFRCGKIGEIFWELSSFKY